MYVCPLPRAAYPAWPYPRARARPRSSGPTGRPTPACACTPSLERPGRSDHTPMRAFSAALRDVQCAGVAFVCLAGATDGARGNGEEDSCGGPSDTPPPLQQQQLSQPLLPVAGFLIHTCLQVATTHLSAGAKGELREGHNRQAECVARGQSMRAASCRLSCLAPGRPWRWPASQPAHSVHPHSMH
eukprot:365182-Chlamydomonas_euryale.AAC.12